VIKAVLSAQETWIARKRFAHQDLLKAEGQSARASDSEIGALKRRACSQSALQAEQRYSKWPPPRWPISTTGGSKKSCDIFLHTSQPCFSRAGLENGSLMCVCAETKGLRECFQLPSDPAVVTL
jgi:hypothetical protein